MPLFVSVSVSALPWNKHLDHPHVPREGLGNNTQSCFQEKVLTVMSAEQHCPIFLAIICMHYCASSVWETPLKRLTCCLCVHSNSSADNQGKLQ